MHLMLLVSDKIGVAISVPVITFVPRRTFSFLALLERYKR